MRHGMTPLEAMDEFDREKFNAAMSEEIENGTCFYNRDTFQFQTHDGKPSLLDLAAKACRARGEENSLSEAYELWMAGWTSHPVTPDSQVMSWYWRRPPRRKGKLGRQFLSTSQAFNALHRELKKPT